MERRNTAEKQRDSERWTNKKRQQDKERSETGETKRNSERWRE